MKRLVFVVVIFLIITVAMDAFALEPRYQSVIQKLVTLVEQGDRQGIARLIRYPLQRNYPIPSIKDVDEFLKRFDEVFDVKLISRIQVASISDDWHEMGWRGVMLDNGAVWVDYDGSIISINYESDFEVNLRKRLIEDQKASLHKSLREFVAPVLEWETRHYRVRVDDMGNGDYRYASWSVDKQWSDKPDLILLHGKIEFEGSGGDHTISFANGLYSYVCRVYIIGSYSTPPGYLEVYRNGVKLLSEPVLRDIIGSN